MAVGGLGLRAASDHCVPIHMKSVFDSRELEQHLLGRRAGKCRPDVSGVIVNRLNERTRKEDILVKLEVALSVAVDLRSHEKLVASIEDSDSIPVGLKSLALSNAGAGAWLNVITRPTIGLHLDLHPAKDIMPAGSLGSYKRLQSAILLLGYHRSDPSADWFLKSVSLPPWPRP